MSVPDNPILSVVVAIVSDTTSERANVDLIKNCLDSLANQVNAPSMEVIVPFHENVDGIEDLQLTYPDVRCVNVPDLDMSSRKGGGREHHDVIRARALAVATGEIVALVEDHGRPDSHWCERIVAAHREGHVAVAGAIENEIDRALNWAVYFCDYGKYQNPLPEGASPYASDSNVSYDRAVIESIRPLWEHSYREVVVNGALLSQGKKVIAKGDIVVYQHRSDLRIVSAIQERYIWGRSYAATRNALLSRPKRFIYAALSPVLPLVLTARLANTAFKRRVRFGKFLRSSPLLILLLFVWSLGEGLGYLRGIKQ